MICRYNRYRRILLWCRVRMMCWIASQDSSIRSNELLLFAGSIDVNLTWGLVMLCHSELSVLLSFFILILGRGISRCYPDLIRQLLCHSALLDCLAVFETSELICFLKAFGRSHHSELLGCLGSGIIRIQLPITVTSENFGELRRTSENFGKLRKLRISRSTISWLTDGFEFYFDNNRSIWMLRHPHRSPLAPKT